eukprot:CAMPEP_0174360778 /NCGR_PEP_ID=MMETSP0811_2-20130205/55946_1 /TAXON_ID=73025 ORGANISM="Eutreptiella gymnastica-like, Strain CCMP1594" /NCGR_SAMPLE_ID=MMETSP0811_2 /ASSEMBLY_ACC=CAM_ASM_000667 /LENGTH=54 /DNA_ID=CAMNT_0015496851 /DNA_START=108 /DNA_END=268 /DNA_ORIENTATION=-
MAETASSQPFGGLAEHIGPTVAGSPGAGVALRVAGKGHAERFHAVLLQTPAKLT